MRDHFSRNVVIHFYTFIPPMKDHLSYKTTFCGPMGGLKPQVSLVWFFYSILDFLKIVVNICLMEILNWLDWNLGQNIGECTIYILNLQNVDGGEPPYPPCGRGAPTTTLTPRLGGALYGSAMLCMAIAYFFLVHSHPWKYFLFFSLNPLSSLVQTQLLELVQILSFLGVWEFSM